MMDIIKIDRTASNHGSYNGTIKLNYDEIISVNNALGLLSNVNNTDSLEKLIYNWTIFKEVTCNGGIYDGKSN